MLAGLFPGCVIIIKLMNFIKQNILSPDFECSDLSNIHFKTLSKHPERTRLEFKVFINCSEHLLSISVN
jgi:hypothetical protein